MLRHGARELVDEPHTLEPALVQIGDHVEAPLKLLPLRRQLLDRLDLGSELRGLLLRPGDVRLQASDLKRLEDRDRREENDDQDQYKDWHQGADFRQLKAPPRLAFFPGQKVDANHGSPYRSARPMATVSTG